MAHHSNEKAADGTIERLSQAQVDGEAFSVSDKQEIDLDHARQLETSYVPNTPEEKALVRKLDWRLVVSLLSRQPSKQIAADLILAMLLDAVPTFECRPKQHRVSLGPTGSPEP